MYRMVVAEIILVDIWFSWNKIQELVILRRCMVYHSFASSPLESYKMFSPFVPQTAFANSRLLHCGNAVTEK